jgi:hypothetical protein
MDKSLYIPLSVVISIDTKLNNVVITLRRKVPFVLGRP